MQAASTSLTVTRAKVLPCAVLRVWQHTAREFGREGGVGEVVDAGGGGLTERL